MSSFTVGVQRVWKLAMAYTAFELDKPFDAYCSPLDAKDRRTSGRFSADRGVAAILLQFLQAR